MAKIGVIGGGFSGLSAAAYISAAGHEVHLFEKNDTLGGRARQLKTATGYVFDMGPSWYWMPDIFENFFADFGHTVSDFYQLKLLDPSFEVIFCNGEKISIPSDFDGLCALFESLEPGSALQLKKFMKEAGAKYRIAVDKMMYLPGLSLFEYADGKLIKMALQSQVFRSFSSHVRKYFSDPRLIALMEFPVLFLGAMPEDIPALYSIMNYAGLKLGTWYPTGGFGKVVEAIASIGRKNGTFFHCNAPVARVLINNNRATGLLVHGKEYHFDAVIATADYSHVENALLPPSCRNYTANYWEKKTFAPSCLIYYVGLTKKLDALQHHSLFLDVNAAGHAEEIYKHPRWPGKPQFYVCCPSKSDASVAPPGHENLFLLMPVAPGLEDSDSLRSKYFNIMLEQLERHVGHPIRASIDFEKSYCLNDFVADYHAYKGNAYGLSNTLRQTALLKPGIRNKKIRNLFYAGQLTVPGPGVPPSIVSGKIAAGQLLKELKRKKNEVDIR